MPKYHLVVLHRFHHKGEAHQRSTSKCMEEDVWCIVYILLQPTNSLLYGLKKNSALNAEILEAVLMTHKDESVPLVWADNEMSSCECQLQAQSMRP